MGGRIEDTIYEADELRQVFTTQGEAHVNIEAENDSLNHNKNVDKVRNHQPNKIWEFIAINFGIYLGSGGDHEKAREHMPDL